LPPGLTACTKDPPAPATSRRQRLTARPRGRAGSRSRFKAVEIQHGVCVEALDLPRPSRVQRTTGWTTSTASGVPGDAALLPQSLHTIPASTTQDSEIESRQKNINGSEWMIDSGLEVGREEVQDMSDRKWDVERPMPILSADVDSEVLTGMHVNEEEEAKWNIEGLVRARYESGVLARRLSSGGGSRGGVWGWAAMTTAYSKHPFPNEHEIRAVEEHHKHLWPPQLPLQYLIIQLKSEHFRRKAPLPLVKLVFETIILAFMGEANCSTTTSLRHMAVGNIESKLIDVFTSAAASSDLQIRTRTGGQPQRARGAAEEPSTEIGPEGGVDGPRWTRGAADLLSSWANFCSRRFP
ncbi:hypothetical protein THAOC_28122, partial [Thalassiosira oceanica]